MGYDNEDPVDQLAVFSAPARNGAELVSVQGEIDLATAGRLAGALRQVGAGGSRAVLVDLTAVTFIDCSGLRVLLEYRRALDVEHRLMVLVSRPGGALDRLLGLAGVRGRFSICGTLDEALTAAALAA